ncbi:IepA [Clostridium perfringens D str. JGS1721]|uniref:RNA-directed DNA polymerase n=2 Tax=Clostridium perfringens TaxID=1502 RepID=B1V349_CLOPF|nr:IepA [Clostridium perfringens D str. JGS1721]
MKRNMPSVSTKLRYNEYYGMQSTFDWLYERSLNKQTKGIDLYSLIISENNIQLAYRSIKSNAGSTTVGTDGIKIDDYKIRNKEEFIKEIRETLENYKPQSIRRVEIPKPNGKKRPLGIPTMRDRIIQQMFKQVLEPICEARFHKHSYGFRPNRATKHALARCCFIASKTGNHYVVDIDIKSFFDNVNHTRLMKQLWNIGIKDKRVLAIIYKMLKAPIKGIGTPELGTPQGGILSPLLSNVVLNDLDWWISNQWETFRTRHKYSYGKLARALRTTNLKEMYIVRYADDFKIFTKTHKSAIKIYHAVKGYLKKQLKLEISPEKSKITNLRRKRSEFLGFEIKVRLKRKQYVTNTFVSRKNKEMIKQEIRKRVQEIQRNSNGKTITKYNSYILGIRNYYEVVSHVNMDFHEITYQTLSTMYNRLRFIARYEIPRSPPPLYKKLFKNNYRTFIIGGMPLFPLVDVQWKKVPTFNYKVCNYTEQGRNLIYRRLNMDIIYELRKILKSSYKNERTEYADNRISKYSGQNGRCAITKMFLSAEEIHCHHIKPISLGGTDKFDNLIIIHKDIHILVHAVQIETISKLLNKFNLNKKQLKKLNTLRKKCNLTIISF